MVIPITVYIAGFIVAFFCIAIQNDINEQESDDTRWSWWYSFFSLVVIFTFIVEICTRMEPLNIPTYNPSLKKIINKLKNKNEDECTE